MSNTFNQNKSSNPKTPFEAKGPVLETVYEAVCCSDRFFYDYLMDMRSGDSSDCCDYCTAFMLA